VGPLGVSGFLVPACGSMWRMVAARFGWGAGGGELLSLGGNGGKWGRTGSYDGGRLRAGMHSLLEAR